MPPTQKKYGNELLNLNLLVNVWNFLVAVYREVD
jgi:hypothetical protein